jgi:hypothetical protein
MRCLDVVRSDWRLPLTCVACDGCMQRRATGGDQSPSLRLHDFVCACEDLVFLFIALHFLFFKIIYSAAFSFQPREVPRGAKPHRVQASSFSQVWGVHGTLLSLVLLRGLVLRLPLRLYCTSKQHVSRGGRAMAGVAPLARVFPVALNCRGLCCAVAPPAHVAAVASAARLCLPCNECRAWCGLRCAHAHSHCRWLTGCLHVLLTLVVASSGSRPIGCVSRVQFRESVWW